MNSRLQSLHEYPFSKLATLLAGVTPNPALDNISLTIGEPQHQPPAAAVAALQSALGQLNKYPSTTGDPALRASIAAWLERRYGMTAHSVDPDTMVLPAVGTREALFAIAQAIVDGEGRDVKPLVIVPSPFYQIYEGAAIMAGADVLYLPCTADKDYLPDLDAVTEDQWSRCQLIYVCNPSNPTGAIPDAAFYQRLLALADQYDFTIASDECYSEIYYDEASPPPGLLEVCYQNGRHDFSRALVFNSLSKRSNLAGMRSGFVAGDAELIKGFTHYRTYHGSAMPMHHQAASIVAWDDEAHVIQNRELYRQKMDAVVPLLSGALEVTIPAAGFCLWAQTGGDDEQYTRELFASQHVRVLPGQYLARDVKGANSAVVNPGAGHIRIALVQSVETCIEAAERIQALRA